MHTKFHESKSSSSHLKIRVKQRENANCIFARCNFGAKEACDKINLIIFFLFLLSFMSRKELSIGFLSLNFPKVQNEGHPPGMVCFNKLYIANVPFAFLWKGSKSYSRNGFSKILRCISLLTLIFS